MRALRKPKPGSLSAWFEAIRRLRSHEYDAIIDAQGLLKTVPLNVLALGPSHGFAFNRAREPLASLAYHHRHRLPGDYHVIELTRRLFAAALGYAPAQTAVRSGLDRNKIAKGVRTNHILFAHGAAWVDKIWPVAQWARLGQLAIAAGFVPLIPHKGEVEAARANDIMRDLSAAIRLSPQPLHELAETIAQCAGVVAGDSGIAHLASALDVPVITLFGPTTPRWSGVMGQGASNIEALPQSCSLRPCMARICKIEPNAQIAPCMASIEAERVWQRLSLAIASSA